jgi:hypothetical protein
MLKVKYDTGSAVKVNNKYGMEIFVPKSQIVLDESGENVLAAKSWIIEEKSLDEEKIVADEAIGLEVYQIDDEECRVYSNNKAYTRKLYYKVKHNMYVFSFKTNMFAFPKAGLQTYTRDEGLVYIGNYEDGYSLDKKVEDYFKVKETVENAKEIIETKEEVKDWSKPVKHYEYETIKSCVDSDIPVYLFGPAGSGKNHTLQQISEELGLDFYFTNSVQQEFKITGFIDAGGNYHETEFYKAFTQGGLFFLDEMDASIPEVLVLLNAAIANGYFEFPNGKEFADPDFRVVAAGNTIGSGSDELYTGRLVLDQATLDRFVSIEFNYDNNIEMHLAKGNKELVSFIQELRETAENTGVRATFSYRAIANVIKLEENKMKLEKILLIAVFKGMDKDTVNTLLKRYTNNKYYKAMEDMVG